MSQQIPFRSGQPFTFTATRTFDLGNTGLKVPRGSEVMFDGTMVSFAGHAPVMMPTLRGAIKVGWIVLSENFDPNDLSAMRPVSAGMQVRSAEGGNPMDAHRLPRQNINTSRVEAEEREVANVAQHTQMTQQRNATNYRREGGEVVRNTTGQMEVIEDQEGVAVRNLKTPAKQATNLEKVNPFTAIQQANAVHIDPGQGKTREEMMAEMDEETRAVYQAQLVARASAYDSEAAARIVGHVPSPGTRQTEGFNVRGSVGGGVDIADLGGTGVAGPNQITQIESEGIKFTNTNGPKKGVRLVPANTAAPARAVPANGQDALCRQIAKSICADFPDNYQFGDPVRKKIARLQADYDDRPDVIRAVAAADTDPEVRQRLVQEFPNVFGA